MGTFLGDLAEALKAVISLETSGAGKGTTEIFMRYGHFSFFCRVLVAPVPEVIPSLFDFAARFQWSTVRSARQLPSTFGEPAAAVSGSPGSDQGRAARGDVPGVCQDQWGPLSISFRLIVGLVWRLGGLKLVFHLPPTSTPQTTNPKHKSRGF